MLTYVSILPQTPLPSRLHNIEQSSMCYTVGPCWLFILNISGVHVRPKLPHYPFPPCQGELHLQFWGYYDNLDLSCLTHVVI